MTGKTDTKKSAIADLYPLTPLQQGLWFHELLDPGSGTYVITNGMRIDGPLNHDAFRQAWETVVAQHPILRTRIVWEGLEQPLQLVQPTAELPWGEQDWRDTPTDRHAARLSDFLDADRARGLDLTRAPLMRLTLIRVAERSTILAWSFHHLILDRWSVDVVMQQVWSAYKALAAGRVPQSGTLRPYRNYLQWQKTQDLVQAEKFWRQFLSGITTSNVLAIDRAPGPRGEHQEVCFESEGITLSEAETTHLSQWARQQKLTVNTLVQGAWSLLISRYSAKEDVVFGITVSGRSAGLSGIESMVGLFINTLPVRTRVSPGDSLVEWLRALQEQQAVLRDYEYTPLFEIQKWSEIPAGEPLFNTILAFENTPMESAEDLTTKGTGLEVVPLAGRGGDQSNYPLNLVVIPGRTLHLKFTYDTRHYTAESIVRMVGHLRAALAEMVGGSGQQRLGAISILTEAERHQLLVEWNETAMSLARDATLTERFEAQVAATPDSDAVVFRDDRLTYAELLARSDALAHHLRVQGIGPEDVVGVVLPRSIDLVVGYLGIVRTGAAYLPIDPALPPDRIAFMLSDAHSPLVLTHSGLEDLLPVEPPKVLCLDREAGHPASPHEAELLPAADAENLAYVIYTSGSTGVPKGVQVTHRSLLNLVNWHQRTFDVSQNDRSTQVAGLSFDATAWELWPYLLAGACVVLAPDEELRNVPEKMRDWLVAERITISFLPTVLAESVLSLSWPLETSLKTMLTGGDRLDQYPGATLPFRLVNNYGPTEYTVVTTSGVIEPVPREDGLTPSIGRPIGNTQVYVLDSAMLPVPVGVYGELYTAGDGLARNYLGQAALSAERFVPDPFSHVPGSRLYRTGDLVRYRPDGTLEFKGRQDYQVQLRGYRIELGEIETALNRHSEVKVSVVEAREDAQGNKRLVGYVVSDEESISPGDLRQHLKQSLPEYMVPAIFMRLDAMPLTPNGKIDRRALPDPDVNWAALSEDFVAPRNPVEAALAGIWEDLLGVDLVGVHDNFFERGGHSLLATQVLSRVHRALEVDVPLREFFEKPTVAGLAELVERHETAPGRSSAIARVLEKIGAMDAGKIRDLLHQKRRKEGL